MAVLLSCRTAKINNGYTFKFNMSEGTRFAYVTNMDMNMKQNMMGTDMTTNNKISLGYNFRVMSDSAGWKNIDATISQIAIDLNVGSIVMKYNSQVPGTDTADFSRTMTKIFDAIQGEHISFTINDTGYIGEVRGMKEMMQKAMLNAKNMANDDVLMGAMSASMDDSKFKQSLQQIFDVYPAIPVKAGDSWTKSRIVNNNGIEMKTDNIYTLQSVNNDTAYLKVVSKIVSAADSTALMGMEIDMNGAMNGNMQYDLPTGLPQRGTMNTKMNMKMKMQGTDMPMEMDMKMTFKGTKL